MEINLDSVVDSALETLLWVGLNWDEMVDDNPTPLENDYSVDDVSTESRNKLRDILKSFVESNAELLAQSGIDSANIGHNFILTANRHGAGFWDLGLGDIGTKLTDMAHPYGEIELVPDGNGGLTLNY